MLWLGTDWHKIWPGEALERHRRPRSQGSSIQVYGDRTELLRHQYHDRQNICRDILAAPDGPGSHSKQAMVLIRPNYSLDHLEHISYCGYYRLLPTRRKDMAP